MTGDQTGGGDGERPRPEPRPAGAHRRRLRFTGLRLRLFAGFVGVAMITVLIITSASYFLIRGALLNRASTSATAQLEAVADNPGVAQDRTPADFTGLVDSIAESGNVVADLITKIGNFPSSSSFTAADIPADFRDRAQTATVQERIVVNNKTYLLTGAKIQPDGPEIYLFTDLSTEQTILDDLITVGAAATGLALLGALAVAFLATRSVLVPIRRLSVAARRLGEGDLEVRLAVKGNDEIADVSRTFNETAQALADSIEELRALDASSRRFVADVSHELRTPLTAMTAMAEVLEDLEDADPATTASAAQLVASETKRLARLVEDLMEISRFDAGTASMRMEEINLPELIEASLAARGWTQKASVSSPELVPLLADARRLDVLIANLVGNALKHGGEPVSVRVHEHEETVVVRVRDSGPGIPPEALPHIFDRFFKADKARRRSEGSGLGLAIAFENARLHAGELSARNHPEGGAVFTFRMPRGLTDDLQSADGPGDRILTGDAWDTGTLPAVSAADRDEERSEMSR
ncbi:MAG TPA: HAMP domain-containing sensor histidine kinase [Actinocrinis sp.]|nr:HAMP domain-containing sensor histidine kinase [Actinocrinis sp.]